ncbi:MAG: DMT family transporter [Rubrivivax sp.]|nr:DMT family transporter [Rubrivivax sp.]
MSGAGAPPAGAASATARWARVLLFVVPALWSTNYVIARLADGVIGPHALALGRWALAAALMLPFVWRPLVRDRHLWLREWKHLLVLGGLGMYICGAWVYIAGQTTTSANIALIYAVTPVTIAALSAWLLHEPMRASQRLGVLMAFAGALYVITRGDLSMLMQMRFAAGDFWVLAAAASWTAYSVLLRKWPSALGPAQRLVAIIAGGLVFLIPGALVEAAVTVQPAWTWAATGLVLLAAVVPGVASYGAYSFLQRELGAAKTALMLYLAPVYGAVLAWLILGERPGWHHAVGAALILPSIWLATRR